MLRCLSAISCAVASPASACARVDAAAFTRIPQALALTIVDLLADGAQKADEICTAFKPQLDRESYVAFMDDIR